MRARMAAAIVVAVGALAGMIAIAVHVRGEDNGTGHLRFASTQTAESPFGAFSEAHVAVGNDCLRVLIASTPGQRSQGLRDVTSLGPYEGMLFVNQVDTDTHYTMAGTPTPLDITFFDADGRPVDGTQMKPCPEGTDATCPEYASKQRYRYALERPAPAAPVAGGLGACAA